MARSTQYVTQAIWRNEMIDIKPSVNNVDQENKIQSNKTWGDRIKSSLLIGLIISGVWMAIMLVTGSYHPFAGGHQGAADMSGLLGNGFGIFVFLSSITFVVKAVRFYFSKPKE